MAWASFPRESMRISITILPADKRIKNVAIFNLSIRMRSNSKVLGLARNPHPEKKLVGHPLTAFYRGLAKKINNLTWISHIPCS